MKKLLLLASFSTFVLLGIWFNQSIEKDTNLTFKKKEIQKDPWQTFEKKPDTITSHTTTKKELDKAKLKTRKPASIAAKYFPRINGRRLYGSNTQQYIDDSSRLTYLNEYNDNWKEKLGDKLLAFQKESVKLFIRKDDGVILLQRTGARLVEKITVSFYHDNGMKTGYEAYVDSETGAVVKTWNQSRHESENAPQFKRSL